MNYFCYKTSVSLYLANDEWFLIFFWLEGRELNILCLLNEVDNKDIEVFLLIFYFESKVFYRFEKNKFDKNTAYI